MTIPTEPIGSIPRPRYLLDALAAFYEGTIKEKDLELFYQRAVKDTARDFEKTGSIIITDGEQSKPSFVTYPIYGSPNLDPDGIVIFFSDGHRRRLPKLKNPNFKFERNAGEYVRRLKQFTTCAIKQAVISVSALSLLYPSEGIDGYSRDAFLNDLIRECENDIRDCLNSGASVVQIDFTEARLAIKIDPTKKLLRQFIDLNNSVLRRFTAKERSRIGVHTCPGADYNSTHSHDVDYKDLLPFLFELEAGNFYLEYAAEKDKDSVLKCIRSAIKDDQRVFLGVIDVNNPRIETDVEVKEMILDAARIIPKGQLGTTDDCGFSPFADDESKSREIAFAKIAARVSGTRHAEKKLFPK